MTEPFRSSSPDSAGSLPVQVQTFPVISSKYRASRWPFAVLAVLAAVLTAFLLWLFLPVGFQKQAQNAAEEYYSANHAAAEEEIQALFDYYEKYHAKHPGGTDDSGEPEDGDGEAFQQVFDIFFDLMTLGMYSYTDPSGYSSAEEYVRAMTVSLTVEKERTILYQGILDRREQNEIVSDLAAHYHEQFTEDAEFMMLVSSVLLTGILIVLTVITLLVYHLLKRRGEKRWTRVEVFEDSVRLGGRTVIPFSGIHRAEAKKPHLLILETDSGAYTLARISNNSEIAGYINSNQRR
ncbi:MAG: hypothetical protein IKQ39_06655 [Oscillospiraceae bacterium]|nr:hypothetical protein [Oscillospiraceae bacterium]